MSKQFQALSRRQLLKLGLAGVGAAGLASTVYSLTQTGEEKNTSVEFPPFENDQTVVETFGVDPMLVLRDFEYGTLKQENGRTIREFSIIAQTTTLKLNNVTNYITWNYNGRVPGPTLRAKEGERVRVLFLNKGGHAHTMHFHGIHPANMDGVKPVLNSKATIYEFDVDTSGVHLYHCHIAPVTRHISKGLYGMLIVDPKEGRPPADEIILIMAGYDLHNKKRNNLYAFNAIPDYYKNNPIKIYQNQLVRVYLLNMIEFDPAVTFHIHANFFDLYPTGMTLTPTMTTDVVTMGTAERHILEFRYPYEGRFMFHPHQDDIAENGCMGNFLVVPEGSEQREKTT